MLQGEAKLRGDFIEHGGGIFRSKWASRSSLPVYWNGPPAKDASHKVLSHLGPGNRSRYVTVCHSFNSGFASTILGFFNNRSLKVSTTAAIAKMPPRRS